MKVHTTYYKHISTT